MWAFQLIFGSNHLIIVLFFTSNNSIAITFEMAGATIFNTE